MKIRALIGRDVPAYTEVGLDVPDSSSKEEIVEFLKQHIGTDDFAEAWPEIEWSGEEAFRAVWVRDQDGVSIMDDVPLSPAYYGAGVTFEKFIKGQIGLDEAVEHAKRLLLL